MENPPYGGFFFVDMQDLRPMKLQPVSPANPTDTIVAVATAPGAGLFSRIYVNDVSGLAAPNRAGSFETIAVQNAGGFANAEVVLVDPTHSALWLSETGGNFPAGGPP